MRLDEKYIPLAKAIAHDVGRKYNYYDKEDLESVAMLALVEAVQLGTPYENEAQAVEYFKAKVRGKVVNYITRDVYGEDPSDCDGAWFMETVEDSYEDKLIAEETTQERENMLHDAIKQLTPQQQRVVKLLHFEGKTQEEAADILGIKQQTVGESNQALMGKLRKIMGVNIA